MLTRKQWKNRTVLVRTISVTFLQQADWLFAGLMYCTVCVCVKEIVIMYERFPLLLHCRMIHPHVLGQL